MLGASTFQGKFVEFDFSVETWPCNFECAAGYGFGRPILAKFGNHVL